MSDRASLRGLDASVTAGAVVVARDCLGGGLVRARGIVEECAGGLPEGFEAVDALARGVAEDVDDLGDEEFDDGDDGDGAVEGAYGGDCEFAPELGHGGEWGEGAIGDGDDGDAEVVEGLGGGDCVAAVAGEVEDDGDIAGSGAAEIPAGGVLLDELDGGADHGEAAVEGVGTGEGGFAGDDPDIGGGGDGLCEVGEAVGGEVVEGLLEGEGEGVAVRGGVAGGSPDALAG